MPQFDFTFYFSQIFWMCISFGMLFWVMHVWIMPKMIYLRDQRIQKVTSILQHAEKIREQGHSLFNEVEKSLDQARIDAKKIISDALSTSQIEINQALMHEQAAYHAQLENILKTIELEREEAWIKINATIPLLSNDMVEKWSKNTIQKELL